MRDTGNRAIVSAGWAGLGKEGVPKDLEGAVYILTSQSGSASIVLELMSRGLSTRLVVC